MRVLVIEDDPGSRDMLTEGLAGHGHETVSVPDFAEGLALAEEGRFDALIVDRMLPGGDGLGIVTALRAQKIATPAIFLTALNEVDDRIAGLQAAGTITSPSRSRFWSCWPGSKPLSAGKKRRWIWFCGLVIWR